MSSICFSQRAKRRSDTVVVPSIPKPSPRTELPPSPKTLLHTLNGRSTSRSPPRPRQSSHPPWVLVLYLMSSPITRTPPKERHDQCPARRPRPRLHREGPRTPFEMRERPYAPEGRGQVQYPALSIPGATCPPKIAHSGHCRAV